MYVCMYVLAQVLWMSEAFQLLVIEVLLLPQVGSSTSLPTPSLFTSNYNLYGSKESITILTIKLKVTLSTLRKSK